MSVRAAEVESDRLGPAIEPHEFDRRLALANEIAARAQRIALRVRLHQGEQAQRGEIGACGVVARGSLRSSAAASRPE